MLRLGSLSGGRGGSSSRLRSRLLLLLLLLLLLRRNILQCLLAVNDLISLLESSLVRDGLEPSEDGGVGVTPGLVEDGAEADGQHGGNEVVSERETLGDEELVGGEVLLDEVEEADGAHLGLLDGLLVVRGGAGEGTDPGSEAGEGLGVAPGHPLQDGGIVLLGLAEESGLLVLRGDCWGLTWLAR